MGRNKVFDFLGYKFILQYVKVDFFFFQYIFCSEYFIVLLLCVLYIYEDSQEGKVKLQELNRDMVGFGCMLVYIEREKLKNRCYLNKYLK